MRSYVVFLLLLVVKLISRIFYRVRLQWVGEELDPWSDLRVLALLNHTSLFEPILVGAAPNRLLWQMAAHGVIPVADKTIARPMAGRFFRLIAHTVIPITRERDDTWTLVLARIHDPRALVVILPEGRMMRSTGLDLQGQPVTVRGGIADILATLPGGRLLLVYSQGLHHVHAPGDRFPRLFKTVHLRGETVDIATYREALLRDTGEPGFKRSVIEDLTRRRDTWVADG
jgi:1-acyl-sn-glycerol-3-phosphate acyltransferase